jgi:leucyl aminopeptidase
MTADFVLPAGDLQAFRATFRYIGSATPCTTGSYDDHDDIVFSTVQADTTPPIINILRPGDGDSLVAPFDVDIDASDDTGIGSVELFVDGVSAGSLNDPPYDFLGVGLGLPFGVHTLEARARDQAGNEAVSAQVSVLVIDPSIAVYDPVLGAPICDAPSARCDTVDLVRGRAAFGPEANAPNTLDSCTDGVRGTPGNTEMVNRVVISSVDGTTFHTGSVINIEVQVFAYRNGASDRLDIYYAPDARAPVWTLVGTQTAPGGGDRTMTRQYTLPAGTDLQAIRARFRYQGSARPCAAGLYNDHDDVAFTVTP